MNLIQLANAVVHRTGIDFNNYRNKEATNAIKNLLSSITKAHFKIFIPVLITVFLVEGFCFPFILNPQYRIWLILYIICTFPVAWVVGFFIGIYRFLSQLINDLGAVLNWSLELSQQIAADAANVATMDRPVPSKKDILEGVLLCVVIPTINEMILNRLGFLSGLVNKLINRLWEYLIPQISKLMEGKQMDINLTQKEIDFNEKIQQKAQTIGNFSAKTGNNIQNIQPQFIILLNHTKKYVLKPMKWLSILLGIFLLFIVLLFFFLKSNV